MTEDELLARVVLETIVALDRQHPWRIDAACRGQQVERWFPDQYDRTPPPPLCSSCPVANDCAAYAATIHPRRLYGYWAGTSHTQRDDARQHPTPPGTPR